MSKNIRGTDGDDTLQGGTGDDRLYGNDGDDTLQGGTGDDRLYGNDGDDTLQGDDGNDRLYGNDGNDTLQGDDGNDTFVFRVGGGQDRIVDFTDGDVIRFESVRFDYSDLVIQQDGNDTTIAYGDGDDKITLTNVQASSLDASDFRFTGVWLSGGAGDDKLEGGPNDDTLEGGAGDDELDGGLGDDTLNGGAGDDTLYGYIGDNTLYGGTGNDWLFAQYGDDRLYGGPGDDRLYGRDGDDTLSGGDGNDIFSFRSPGGRSVGQDRITDFADGDIIRFWATFGYSDLDIRQAGNDTTIAYGDGDDQITLTNVQASSLDSDDFWFSGVTLSGGPGDDELEGGPNNDTLRGNDGNDTLQGGAGDDWLSGGAGDDTFVFRAGDGQDRIVDFADGDIIRFESVRFNYSDLDIQQDGNDTTIAYGDGDDKITLTNVQASSLDAGDFRFTGVTLSGGDGDDRLSGGVNDDTLSGGDGDDRLSGGVNDDTLSGGDGDDTFVFRAGDGQDRIADFADGDIIRFESVRFNYSDLDIQQDGNDTTIAYGDGDDQITLTNVQASSLDAGDFRFTGVTLSGGAGDDTLQGGLNDDTLSGNDGDDALSGGVGDDTLQGGRGDDTLVGDRYDIAGDDTLSGGAGDDTLQGGDGDDTLEGGDGDDTFVFDAGDGQDRIADFANGDIIQFDRVLFDYSDLDIQQDGNDTTIAYGDGDGKITLTNVQASSLDSSDFWFSGWSFGLGDSGLSRTSRGSAGDDGLSGGAGDDGLPGGAGDDTLEGNRGDDWLSGGAGDDTFVFRVGDGQDRIADFAEGDIIRFEEVRFDYSDLDIQQVGNDTTIAYGDGDDQITLANVQASSLDASDFRFVDGHRFSYSDGWRLYGGDGDDWLQGRQYRQYEEMFSGGAGDDTLQGGRADDWLQGGAGDDTFVFRVGDGQDRITDFADGDIIRFERVRFDYSDLDIQQDGNDTTIAYGDGDDQITLDNVQASSLDASNFQFAGVLLYAVRFSGDTLEGSEYDDRLYGGKGNDTLYGGAGEDNFVFRTGDGGQDRIADFAEGDIIRFEEVRFDYSGLDIRQDGNDTTIAYGDGDSKITLTNVQASSLDAGDFRFTGVSLFVTRGDGTKLLSGGAGDDTFVFRVGDGQNRIVDFADGDIIRFQSVDFGYSDLDIQQAGSDTTIAYGDGDDQITLTNVQASSLDSSDFKFIVLGRNDNDTLRGGSNDDTLSGGDGDDTLEGGDGDDRLYGNDGDDTLRGGAGDDWLQGGAGDDTLRGGAGDDTLQGGAGDDTLQGGAGDDTLQGGAGDDTLEGGDGDDTLQGGAGDDTLEGGDGDDTLQGGAGDDTLEGGDGDDTFAFFASDGQDRIVDFADGDIIQFQGVRFGYSDLDIQQAGNDTTIAYGDGDDQITLTNVQASSLNASDFRFIGETLVYGFDSWGDDVLLSGGPNGDLLLGGAGDDTLSGGDGDDTLLGGFGDDTLSGGDGDDWLQGGGGDDELEGNAGDDTFEFRAGDGQDRIADFADGDIIQFTRVRFDYSDLDIQQDGNDTTIAYGDGDDQITLSNVQASSLDASDFQFTGIGVSWFSPFVNGTLEGGKYDDWLAGGDGSHWLYGYGGDDTLRGGAGNDTLQGGAGNDTLQGGGDDDWLQGGAGDDTFEFRAGHGQDRIVDFAEGDIIRFENVRFGYSDLDIQQAGSDTTIAYGDGDDQITLSNVQASSLDTGDFQFTGGVTVGAGSAGSTLEGGVNDDWLQGGAGDNWLQGGAGDNWLYGGKGNDMLVGWAGDDTFVFRAGDGQDRIANFADGDIIRFESVRFGYSDLDIQQAGSDTTIAYGDGDDKITLFNVQASSLDAGDFRFFDAEGNEIKAPDGSKDDDVLDRGNNTDDMLNGNDGDGNSQTEVVSIDVMDTNEGFMPTVSKPVVIIKGNPNVADPAEMTFDLDVGHLDIAGGEELALPLDNGDLALEVDLLGSFVSLLDENLDIA